MALTQFARGTPGYRAPELLVQESYTDKVDIWALGCILHELATGQKPFQTDLAVEQYRYSKTPITVQCHESFDNALITSTVHDMLQVIPSLRPSASKMHSLFSRYYQLVSNVSPTSPSLRLDRLSLESDSFSDSEDWEGKLSWIPSNPDSPVPVFRTYDQKPGTDWFVLHVIINKPNNRIVLVSCDEDQENFSIKLYNLSGTVFWQKKDVITSVEELVLPAFSEDGKHLILYIQGNLEIVDARPGTTVNLISLGELKPVALAITRNAKKIGNFDSWK